MEKEEIEEWRRKAGEEDEQMKRQKKKIKIQGEQRKT